MATKEETMELAEAGKRVSPLHQIVAFRVLTSFWIEAIDTLVRVGHAVRFSGESVASSAQHGDLCSTPASNDHARGHSGVHQGVRLGGVPMRQAAAASTNTS